MTDIDPAAVIAAKLAERRQRVADRRAGKELAKKDQKGRYQDRKAARMAADPNWKPDLYGNVKPPNPRWQVLPIGMRLTVAEVAAILEVAPMTIFRYTHSKTDRKLPANIMIVRGAGRDTIYLLRVRELEEA